MEERKLRYVRFWLDPWRELAKELSCDEAGQLLKAALKYADAGEDTEYGTLSPLYKPWAFLRAEIDRDAGHVLRKAEWRRG